MRSFGLVDAGCPPRLGLNLGPPPIRLPALSDYSSLEADFHDPFWEAEGPSAELPLLTSFLECFPGTSIEIGCGSGRLLMPLLAAGFDVEGIEPSADMLLLCTQKAAGAKPVLHHGTIEGFSPNKSYAAATVPAFTLQLVEDPALMLASIARILEPGGGLYLSVFRPEAELAGEIPANEWHPDYETRLKDGRIAAMETRYRLDRPAKLLHREHRYLLLDSTRQLIREHLCQQTLRWFGNRELFQLIESAGFEIDRAYGEFDPDDAVRASTPDKEHQIVTIHASLA